MPGTDSEGQNIKGQNMHPMHTHMHTTDTLRNHYGTLHTENI